MKTATALKILAEWLEEDKLPELVRREVQTIDLERLVDILAIVGPRRAGKTYFMYQLVRDILATGHYEHSDILFIDFEDYRLIDFQAADIDTLLAAFQQLTGKYPKFLFFDEVQHLPDWSRVLRTLHNRRKYRIIVSGSNSELLSREISTELRGRYRDLFMLPFSFRELLRYKDVAFSERTLHTPARGRILQVFDSYLKEGGFPEVVSRQTSSEKRQVLQNYYHTIFYRDILERYNIKAKYVLEAIMSYCLNSYADLLSISAFEKNLKKNDLPGSKRTISNYLHYLEEAFFLILNEKFSYSPRKRIMNPKKAYLMDTGFRFLSTDFSENRGKVLENAVAVELRRREEEVFYYKGRRECDFIIKRGTRPTLAIQVCWELHERNESRELKGLAEALRTFEIRDGLILTYDQEEERRIDEHRIPVLPVWRWLLMNRGIHDDS
jgi:hypothetical protein